MTALIAGDRDVQNFFKQAPKHKETDCSMKVLMYAMIMQFACIVTYGQERALPEATPPERTPTETIAIWNAGYGTAEMDACADVTTARMRDDKPKSVWVYDTWKKLNRLGYRKETSAVLQEKIDGDTAVVVLQTRIYADDVYSDQKELFTLMRVDGVWLIDALRVGDEILETQPEQL